MDTIKKSKWLSYPLSLLFAVTVGIAGVPGTRFLLVQFSHFVHWSMPLWLVMSLSIFVGGFCVGLLGFIAASSLLPYLFNRTLAELKAMWLALSPFKKAVFTLGLVCVLTAGFMLTATAIFLSAFILGSVLALIAGVFVALVIASLELEAFLRYFDKTTKTSFHTNRAGFFCKMAFNAVGMGIVGVNALGLSLLSAAALFFLLTTIPWIGMSVMPAFILALCLSSTTFIARMCYYGQRVTQTLGLTGARFGNYIGTRYFHQEVKINAINGRETAPIIPDLSIDKHHKRVKPALIALAFFRCIAWGAGNAFGMIQFGKMLVVVGLSVPPMWAIFVITVGIVSFISALLISASFIQREFKTTLKTLSGSTGNRGEEAIFLIPVPTIDPRPPDSLSRQEDPSPSSQEAVSLGQQSESSSSSSEVGCRV